MRHYIAKIVDLFAPSIHWRKRLKGLETMLGEDEIQLLPYLCRKDKLSIDVGAAGGVYAIHMARYSRTIAFEPRRQQSSELMLMARYGELPIAVEPIALSDKAGTITMRVLDEDPGRSTIEQANDLNDPDGSSVSQVLVDRKTLDSYLLEDVGVIKIDVEGHEISVLAGAKETLTRCNPSIIIEVENRHRPNAVDDVRSFLEGQRYSGYFFLNGLLTPIAKFNAEIHQNPMNIGSWKSNWARHGIYVNNFLFLTSDALDLVSRFNGTARPTSDASDGSASRENRRI
jgi:FkbM family methyltransferase